MNISFCSLLLPPVCCLRLSSAVALSVVALAGLSSCAVDEQASSADRSAVATIEGGNASAGIDTLRIPSQPATLPIDTFAGAIGFYDRNRDGSARTVRDDLTGTLSGMIQFAQSHTVDPAGNAAKEMPRLVPSRNALLLFTPQSAAVSGVRLEVQVDGEPRLSIPMQAPELLPESDYVDVYGRPRVVYSKRAWSAHLPWSVVRPGLSLQIFADGGLQGRLDAQNIEFGAPAKLVVWGVRIGMLTDPPVNPANQPMLSEPAVAAIDYFQTIPVSQLTIASYEDQRLTEVMLADGTVLTGASTVNGGVYTGDLREDVGKSQYSIGINEANYGNTSTINGNQDPDYTTPQLVYHHSAGNYANGRQVHGLSGGGTIATLYDSIGNEWSHELGHHYGMGHYPGASGGNYFWAGHHADSGWGYIDHRRRFRSNLAFYSAERTGLRLIDDQTSVPESFAALYSYNADAMSGGHAGSPALLSRYTHHTGYTARRMQDFMDRAWYDPASATGYSRWDAATRKVVEARPAGKVRPTRFGVPVFTLLGGYDPLNARAVMYPPAKGNYGMVYDNLPAPDQNAAQACWVEVTTATATRAIALSGSRISSTLSNKFHINIAQADDPRSAALYCRSNGTARKLDDVVFPSLSPALPPAVVIGETAGYEAAATEELARLRDRLHVVASDEQPVADYSMQIWVDSWSERLSQLDTLSRNTLERIELLKRKGIDLDVWMSANATALDARDPEMVRALRARLTAFGLIIGSGYASSFAPIVSPFGCLAMWPATGDPAAASVVILGPSACNNSRGQLWLLDKRGALRNGAFPGHCVTLQGSRLALVPCDPQMAEQLWTWTSALTLTSIARPGYSMDANLPYGPVIANTTHGGATQQWRDVRRDRSALVSLLSGANVARLYAIEPIDRRPPQMVPAAPSTRVRGLRACDGARACPGGRERRPSARP
ncbi:MAG: hypothetical protein E6Q88_10555 [Lysobacteraceae bacterium]|nr:MAG: hypothetical protein E6Q88_10555 [Xanthomonadaceae bacterium]